MDFTAEKATEHPEVKRLTEGLSRALGSRLVGVVLYGSAARGDFAQAASDLNLIVVLEDMQIATIEAAAPALLSWERRGQPLPRLFSPELIAQAADVFPIELLDLKCHRVVLAGRDPFEAVEVRLDHLRLQCERELREKLMRLTEGFVQAAGRPRALRRLLLASYGPFLALFRGCLHLLGGEVPARSSEVVAAFCERAGIDREAFEAVERLRKGAREEPAPVFTRYYDELRKAVARVDRFSPGGPGDRS